MIRVLFVDHAPAMGGAEHSLALLLQHLDRARFHSVLACAPGPLAEVGRAAGIVVSHVPMPRLRREVAAAWETLLSFDPWHRMVHEHGLPRPAVRRQLVQMLLAVVGPQPAARSHSRPRSTKP